MLGQEPGEKEDAGGTWGSTCCWKVIFRTFLVGGICSCYITPWPCTALVLLSPNMALPGAGNTKPQGWEDKVMVFATMASLFMCLGHLLSSFIELEKKKKETRVLISLHLWGKQSLDIHGARIRPHTLQSARERWWQGGQSECRQGETGKAAIPTAQLSLKTLEVFTQERLLLPKHVILPKREFNIVKWLLVKMWYQRAPHPPGLWTKCLPLSPLVGVE